MILSWVLSLRAADLAAPFEARVVAAYELVRTRKAFCQGNLAFDRSV